MLILTVVDDCPVGMFLDPLLVHLNDAQQCCDMSDTVYIYHQVAVYGLQVQNENQTANEYSCHE